MREQLFQLAPQLVLFLHKIEKLSFRQLTSSGKGMSVQRYTTPPPQQCSALIPNNCSYSKVCLSFADKEAVYHVWQQEFPVHDDHEADHRRDVQSWMITLAFPFFDDYKFAGQPDVYAFLPTKLTAGFPFIINADFLLVSSRESIKFESRWNQGILSCIPQAFIAAFMFFLKAAAHLSSSPLTSMYNYVPSRSLHIKELGFVRNGILEQIKTHMTILCDADMGQRFPTCSVETVASDRIGSSAPFFCLPSMARMIPSEFGLLLRDAHRARVEPPQLLTSQGMFIVNTELQEKYCLVLSTLQVGTLEYIKCLTSPHWLQSLPEALYVQVLCLLSSCDMRKLPIDLPLVKYVNDEGNTQLLAPGDKHKVHVYMSKLSRDERFLSQWRPVFQRWVDVHFMPRKTVHELNDLSKDKYHSVCTWLKAIANVEELSVQSYAEAVVCTLGEGIADKADLAVGGMHFLLHAIYDGYLKLNDCKYIIQKLPLVNKLGKVRVNSPRTILLPGSVCVWPRVLLHGSWEGHVLCLSEEYLAFPSFISIEIGSHSTIQFLKKAIGAVDIFDIKNPPCAPIDMKAPWGEIGNDVRMFLDWIKGLSGIPSSLEKCLMESKWVKTVDHGQKKPSESFLDLGQWSCVLNRTDVPFVDDSFYGGLHPYKDILRELGMVTRVEDGAYAVASHMRNLSKQGYSNVQSHTAIRWYTYLRMRNWSSRPSSEKLIWVPGHPQGSYSLGSWRSSGDCVVSDSGGLFHDRLVVLDNYYRDNNVLKFFEHNMGVAAAPGTEKYCQLWVDWGANRKEVSTEACQNAWCIIAQGWGSCASTEVQNFKQRCKIPCIANDDAKSVEFVRPEEALYADDLVLAEIFSKAHPRPKFVWCPRGAAAAPWVEHLVECYADLGVKKLSDTLEGGGPFGYTAKNLAYQALSSSSYRGRVGKGVYRAILGYLADPKHRLSAAARKRMVMQLENVEVWQAKEVGEVKYRVAVGRSVYEANRTAYVRWEKGERRIYIAVPNGCNKVKVVHELATELAKGVVGAERMLLVKELQQVLMLAAAFSFDDDAVKVLLCLHNLRLTLEDEALLADIPKHSTTVACLPY